MRDGMVSSLVSTLHWANESMAQGDTMGCDGPEDYACLCGSTDFSNSVAVSLFTSDKGLDPRKGANDRCVGLLSAIPKKSLLVCDTALGSAKQSYVLFMSIKHSSADNR